MTAHPARLDFDAADMTIVEALQRNGRMSFAELGRMVGLSQPAVSERVRRLEEKGVITGYTARVDPAALGLGMTAVIRLQTSHQHIQTCLKSFRDMPHVVAVDRVTGEDCFILKVVVPSPSALEPIVDSIARFGTVKTSIVLRHEPDKPITLATLRAAVSVALVGSDTRNSSAA